MLLECVGESKQYTKYTQNTEKNTYNTQNTHNTQKVGLFSTNMSINMNKLSVTMLISSINTITEIYIYYVEKTLRIVRDLDSRLNKRKTVTKGTMSDSAKIMLQLYYDIQYYIIDVYNTVLHTICNTNTNSGTSSGTSSGISSGTSGTNDTNDTNGTTGITGQSLSLPERIEEMNKHCIQELGLQHDDNTNSTSSTASVSTSSGNGIGSSMLVLYELVKIAEK